MNLPKRYGKVIKSFHNLVRRNQERSEGAIQQLRDMLDRADASGLSGRTLPEIMEAAGVEARQRGLLRDED